MEHAAEVGILHRDCSLNNAMIEDLEDGTSSSRGLLLDWEFGVEVNEENSYNVGGTVSRSSYMVNRWLIVLLRAGNNPIYVRQTPQPAQGHIASDLGSGLLPMQVRVQQPNI